MEELKISIGELSPPPVTPMVSKRNPVLKRALLGHLVLTR